MRKPLVVGNWKMNGSLKLTGALLRAIEDGINDKISSEVSVCVPFVYIALAIDAVDATRLTIGAQTVSEFESGAYTGEISANMLAELGCHWVLVGHSERRMLFNESNQVLVAKVLAAQRAGLVPIYCVGESEADYKSSNTLNVIKDQVGALLSHKAVNLNQLVLAYEPVWAIGTGLTASPEEAQQAHVFIRGLVREKAGDLADKVRILYGGSVNPDNASSLFEQEDIDGGLIGGASLDADAFISICQKA
ncbi:MAG: triose-phosphate isomerase [Cycloclasticus sp.]|nr:triose-phosphate isomerase [Cycloclasticus sp.]